MNIRKLVDEVTATLDGIEPAQNEEEAELLNAYAEQICEAIKRVQER